MFMRTGHTVLLGLAGMGMSLMADAGVQEDVQPTQGYVQV